MDTKTNIFGRSLVEILSANSLICLCGRTKGYPLGNFTCFTPKGNSVVDYVILNDDLFNDVVYLKVNPLSYLSGHCPISFALKSGSFCRYTNEDSFLKEKHGMASGCFKRRKIKLKRQNKISKCNKQSDKWFDKTLEEMEQEILRTAKILNKYPNDPIIRGKYYTLKKKF